jgi:hypothetical protein
MPYAPGPGANGSLSPKFTTAGVLSFDTPKLPLGIVLVGAVIDVGTGTSTSNFTQFNTYSTAPPIGPDAAGQRTNETINFSFREGVNSSLRAKVGVPILNYWALVYFTAGVAVAKTEASYSYTATNFAPGCAPGAGCATNVFGSASFNQTRTGFSGGGGATGCGGGAAFARQKLVDRGRKAHAKANCCLRVNCRSHIARACPEQGEGI